MKTFLSFIRSTVTGGILFLLPVVLIITLFGKAYNILLKLSAPFAEKLPDLIFGLNGSKLLTLFLLIFICFMSGLLFRSGVVKKWIGKIEDNILVNFPGYVLIKSITAGTLGKQSQGDISPILIQEEDSWSLAFLIEQGEVYSTVFIPDAPRHDAGEIKIIPSNCIKKLDISSNKFSQSIKAFGKGSIKWVE